MVSFSMSVIGNLSPLLFITFRSLYGFSYSLLGLLVLINFVTQLSIDLVFSFFSHKFNIEKTVKFTPALALVGFLAYALLPQIIPEAAFLGIAIGTVIFSGAGGLAEVLISPVIAAIPSDNPDREMSGLHSIYAWGVVAVISIGTFFLLIFDAEQWFLLPLIFCVIPLLASVLYIGVDIPKIQTPEKVSGAMSFLRSRALYLCFFAIFLGGAAECTMAQWASGYIERALGISKVWGDIFGVAAFAATLGIGRTLYAKYGKNIERVLLLSAVGATVCYAAAALSNVAVIGLVACAFTGFCTAVMWPGCLVVASEKFPTSGVFIYAMMAAGGDLGASVGPQLVGMVADFAMSLQGVQGIALNMGITAEQIGLKLGMLIGGLFPLAAIFVYAALCRQKRLSLDKN